jgi:hypothetical protein
MRTHPIACHSVLGSAGTGRRARSCRGGNPPIRVSSRTSCGLTVRILNRVYSGPAVAARGQTTISVSLPVTGRGYRIRLVRRGDYVAGTGCGESGRASSTTVRSLSTSHKVAPVDGASAPALPLRAVFGHVRSIAWVRG